MRKTLLDILDKPAFSLQFEVGVAPKPKQDIANVFWKLSPLVESKHDLCIFVVSAILVSYKRLVGFGMFIVEGGSPRIVMGGELPPSIEPKDYQISFAETMAHELAHYEQWRDGRRLQERGVSVRVNTLFKRAGIGR
jgi:hypothetical protein